MPARLLVLDFDGTSKADRVTALTAIPTWRGADTAIAEPSFVGEIAALQTKYGGYERYKYLDMNLDGKLDRLDGELLAAEVIDGVKQRYAAFAVDVVREDDTRAALAKMNNGVGGDMFIMVHGYHEFLGGQTTGGSPDDIRANVDRIGGVSASVAAAKNVTDYGLTGLEARRGFVNIIANTIAHEAGHAYGLPHVFGVGSPGSLMTPTIGGGYQVFQDVSLQSDTGTTNEFRTLNKNVGLRVNDAAFENASPQSVTINGSRSEFVRAEDGSVWYRRQEFPNFSQTQVRGNSNTYRWSEWRNLGGFVKSFSVVQSGADGGIVEVIGIGGNDAV